MAKKQALPDEEIKFILKLLDMQKYTQKELAERYHVAQGTISRYNRIKRLQFKSEKYAKIIAEQNKEIIQLKAALDLDLTKELSVPKSFKHCKITLENGKVLDGFESHDHYECCRYVERHPEYSTYAMTVDPKNPEQPEFFRGRVRVGLFNYFVSPENFGHITYKKQIRITKYEPYEEEE